MITGASVSLVGFVIRSKYNDFLLARGFDITVYVFIGFCIAMAFVGLLHLRRKAIVSGLISIVLGLGIGYLCYHFLDKLPFKLSGRLIMFHASLISIAVYFVVSELTRSQDVNFNEIFNRSAEEIESRKHRRWWQFAPEVPKTDRILIPCIYAGIITFVACFIAAWIYNATHEVGIETWLKFWHVYVYAMFLLGVAFMVWVITGGFRDLIHMFKNLTAQQADADDDGSVEGHHAAGKE
jgi:hypothetical protein